MPHHPHLQVGFRKLQLSYRLIISNHRLPPLSITLVILSTNLPPLETWVPLSGSDEARKQMILRGPTGCTGRDAWAETYGDVEQLP